MALHWIQCELARYIVTGAPLQKPLQKTRFSNISNLFQLEFEQCKRQTSAAFHFFLLIIMITSQFGGAWNGERIES